MMTTLKDHQATMVSMLASGTAIPTSAIRLAHALHDVLAYLNDTNTAPVAHTERRVDATTPGLNDALLAEAFGMGMSRYSGAFKTLAENSGSDTKQHSLESLLKQRDNTIRQLRESNLKLRAINYEMLTHIAEQQSFLDRVKEADAVKLRQSDCEHNFKYRSGAEAGHCLKCGLRNVPEQAGCRKEDTQLPDDGWIEWGGGECPIGREVAELKFRDGTYSLPSMDGHLSWQHFSSPDDIVAYRVVKP